MLCPNCQSKLIGNETFCGNCGAKIVAPISVSTNVDKVNQYNKKIVNKTKVLLSKIGVFIKKYKWQFSTACGALLLFIIGLFLFNFFYDYTFLSWNKDQGDYNITFTAPSSLELSVTALDKDKKDINNINFSVTGGSIVSDGRSVTWHLPNTSGNYIITATSPSGKNIKKDVRVVILNDDKSLAGVLDGEEITDKTDSDDDSLTDYREKELGTSPYLQDTDGDGISDYYEVSYSKTDPLKKDTDGDGINDGDELDLNLDSLKVDSKGDGINDSQRVLDYTVVDKNQTITLTIKGQGNIASTTIDTLNNPLITNKDGLLDQIYNFHSSGTLNSVKVAIKYTLEQLQSKNINEDNLTLYFFNDNKKVLEAIPTTINKETKEVSAELKQLSKYVIGDKNQVLAQDQKEIMFVIDNSVSMYTNKQMDEFGYTATGAVGNDSEFKRISLTNKMISTFSGNYKFGVSEFAGSYYKIKDFSNDKNAVMDAVSSIKGKWNVNLTGTNIVTALNKGIEEFKNTDINNYLIFLTDGKNTSGSLSSNKLAIINKAKSSKVKVCVIGLGKEIDAADLKEIAETTGCNYYSASQSSALDEIYNFVGSEVNYNYVDTDNDGKEDGIIQANSGFMVNRDGFSFDNFTTNRANNGNCYGMALFASLYYQKKLPTSLPAIDKSRFYFGEMKVVDFKSAGYNLGNTYFSKNTPLYDYQIKNEALRLFLYSLPTDYRNRVVDKTWLINDKYYKLMGNIGSTFKMRDYDGPEEDIDKYQSAMFNLDNDQYKKSVTKEEEQLFEAIWRLFVLQSDSKATRFSSSPDKAYAELTNSLNNKNPQILDINSNHAVNAIRMIQDMNDANKMKIAVYDNNYAGETRYIRVERTKYSKWQLDFTAWTNEYQYKFYYDHNDDGKEDLIKVNIQYPSV